MHRRDRGVERRPEIRTIVRLQGHPDLTRMEEEEEEEEEEETRTDLATHTPLCVETRALRERYISWRHILATYLRAQASRGQVERRPGVRQELQAARPAAVLARRRAHREHPTLPAQHLHKAAHKRQKLPLSLSLAFCTRTSRSFLCISRPYLLLR